MPPTARPETVVRMPEGKICDGVAHPHGARGDASGRGAEVAQRLGVFIGDLRRQAALRTQHELHRQAEGVQGGLELVLAGKRLEQFEEGRTLVPGRVGGPIDDVVALERRDGDHVDVVDAELGRHGLDLVGDPCEGLLRVAEQVDLVDRHDHVRHAKQGDHREVAAGLLEDALAAVDQHDHGVGGRGAGDHVARVLHVTGAIGEDEAAVAGGEIAVGDVDRDALLALGAEAIGQQCEVELAVGEPALGGRAGHLLELIGEDRLGVVQQTTDEGRLAVVDRPGRREAEEGRALEPGALSVMHDGHQKYPSFLRSSIAASEMRSSARVAPRSVRVERAISATIDVRSAASDSTAPVQLMSPTVR